VQPSATPDGSLVMRLGQRFESARRLFTFIEVRWEISANGILKRFPMSGMRGWNRRTLHPGWATRRPPCGGLWRNAEVAARVRLCWGLRAWHGRDRPVGPRQELCGCHGDESGDHAPPPSGRADRSQAFGRPEPSGRGSGGGEPLVNEASLRRARSESPRQVASRVPSRPERYPRNPRSLTGSFGTNPGVTSRALCRGRRASPERRTVQSFGCKRKGRDARIPTASLHDLAVRWFQARFVPK
jgi:hypothetical protein